MLRAAPHRGAHARTDAPRDARASRVLPPSRSMPTRSYASRATQAVPPSSMPRSASRAFSTARIASVSCASTLPFNPSVASRTLQALHPSPLHRQLRRGTSTSQPPASAATPVPPAAEPKDQDDGIATARWASWAGLIPFVAGAAASVYLPSLGMWGLQWSHYLMWVQMSYGACVLSFLGALHWGLALAPNAEARRARIVWSVLPSLWATAAQAVPPLYGAPLLMIGFVAALVADSRAARAGLLPDWYVKMRVPITMGVVASIGTSFIKLL